MVNRNYSSTAAETTLQAGITGSGTIAQVVGTSGFPAAPFTLVLDPGTLYEELVTVTSVAATTLTIVRGEDGTSGVSHEAGAVVRHVVSARDLTEAAQHIAATGNVHGVGATSAVVGTQATQTLRNKSIDSSNDVDKGALPSDVVYRTGSQTLSDKTIDSSNSIANGALPSGVLFATGSKTVSDKTFDTSNTYQVPTPTASSHATPKSYVDDATEDLTDTGWVSSAISNSNFTGTKRYRVKNGWGVFQAQGSRTSGSLSAADLVLLTIADSGHHPSEVAYGMAWVGNNSYRAYVDVDGTVHVQPLTISAPQTIQVYITWPVG